MCKNIFIIYVYCFMTSLRPSGNSSTTTPSGKRLSYILYI